MREQKRKNETVVSTWNFIDRDQRSSVKNTVGRAKFHLEITVEKDILQQIKID
jgi:hypothetical protein